MPGFDPATFSDWIGRGEDRQDVITPRLIDQFTATLAGSLAPSSVPLGLFWCLCPDALPASDLGRDAHPRTGIYLPDLPLPRRMWAGGDIALSGLLHPNDRVTRVTRIEDVTCKAGGSGPLGFVSVRHLYRVDGVEIVNERQTLVYREDPKGTDRPNYPLAPDLGPPLDMIEVTPDPVLLFRFSALTFNGHRIHYDHPYATEVEGYDGLVVHGPLQALWMLNLAARVFGQQPGQFSYRGVSPLVAQHPIRIEAYQRPDDGLDLRVRIVDGPVTMTGQARPA